MEASGIDDAGAVPGDGCASCGATLADDQRYCLECGRRVGPLRVPGVLARDRRRVKARPSPGGGAKGAAVLPFRLPPLRMPVRRSAGAMTMMALAFGVFVGLALSPAFRGAGLAASRYVIQLPGGGGGEESQASASSTSPSATLGSPVGNVGGGGTTTQPPANATAQVPTSTGTPPAADNPPPDTNTKKGGNGGGKHHRHEGQTESGIVVHVNPLAKSYTLATNDGDLVAIHSSDLPDPRTRLKVGVRSLLNGTYAEAGERTESSPRGNATFLGNVTYRDPEAKVYTVSAVGTSVLIHVPNASQADDLPPLNDEVSVSVTVQPPPSAKDKRAVKDKRAAKRMSGPRRHRSIRLGRVKTAVRRAKADAPDGCSDQPIPGPEPSSILEQRQVIIEGPSVAPVNVEGIVERACADSGELSLSADDIRESGADIPLTPSESIDLSKLDLGMPIDAAIEIGTDGSYSVTGLYSDDGAAGADDSSAAQGIQTAKR
jgi:hypothetical protein